jgi:Zn-dependent membrane protease YugP
LTVETIVVILHVGSFKEVTMFFDPLYFLFMVPAFLLSLWAQLKVKSAVAKFSKIPNSSNLTGAQVADAILKTTGISDVEIEPTDGVLSDHYDPSKKVLRLSRDVFYGRSIVSAGIAAHEVGHAIQHKNAYSPLVLRQTLAPAAMFGSNISWILILLGFILSSAKMLWLGIGLFSLAVLFTLITLPVEFDASRRAKEVLLSMGLVSNYDREGVSAVLNAAAMTYVAAAATAILQLIYLILRAQSSSRD